MAERGPSLVVAACIVRGDSVLVAQRHQPPNPQAHLHWELPGGKVEMGESPHTALVREIHEELGVAVEIVRLLPHLQSNIYYLPDGGIAHSVVLAFECVLARGEPRPRPAESAVRQVKWIARHDVSDLPLLPGTQQFVDCLDKVDRASFEAATLYVRLEKHPPGKSPSYYELYCVSDLWGGINLFERRVNLQTRSSSSKLTRDIPEEGLLKRMIQRVRALVRYGYVLTVTSDPRIAPGLRLSLGGSNGN